MKALLSVLVLFGFMGIANAQEGDTGAPAAGAEMNGGETREPAKAHHKKAKKKKSKKSHKGNM